MRKKIIKIHGENKIIVKPKYKGKKIKKKTKLSQMREEFFGLGDLNYPKKLLCIMNNNCFCL